MSVATWTSPEDRLTAVYRFYDDQDRLLYVGITCNLTARLRDHEASAPWWADHRAATVNWQDNRAIAVAEERFAIQNEKPIYNVAGTRQKQARVRAYHPDPATRAAIATEVRAEIARAGRSKREIRELLGLSRQSAWLRMRGEIAFQDEELYALADLLDISVATFFPFAEGAS